jgi:hypothetical protein
MLSQSGNNQSGSVGTALSQSLTVTLNPGQSGFTATGASILVHYLGRHAIQWAQQSEPV